NNAGIGGGDVIESFDEEVWEQVLGVNLTGVLHGCKYAWPHLKKTRGAIVNMSSVAGLRGVPGFAAYGASKAGVLQLTRVAAREGAPYGIRANAICPTFIQTPMVASYLQGFDDPEATRKRLIHGIPLGRLGDPRDVAYAALYLASDEASFITGIALPVDGGATA
ncbi:MAG: SDR family oxidoreductase, partial [Chloroflexi bacterium]|nr:SDR family oxidoreductase [Chloroflexota bacterium]